MEGLLEMNNKERERLKTLVRLTDKTLNQRLAAKQLGIGTQQVGFIVQNYHDFGPTSAHEKLIQIHKIKISAF